MPPNWFRSASSQPVSPPPPSEAIQHFQDFVEATEFSDILEHFDKLLGILGLSQGPFRQFYPALKAALQPHVPYKYKEIWKILDKRSSNHKVYNDAAEAKRVLVVGAGPCGLRMAVEAQMLGAKTMLIEKRAQFSRNNVLKLWKFLVEDLKALGIKKFHGKFCSGGINHIGIRQMQLVLSKICLLLGIRIVAPAALVDVKEPQDGIGWTAKLAQDNKEVADFEMDMIVIATGKKVPIEGFNRRSLDAKLAVAVTANFVNKLTSEEYAVNQISGISKQYHQDFFKDMETKTGIQLENIVYYRGETHYFVMTALKNCLLAKGVIKEDLDDRAALLAPNNIDRDKLYAFSIEASQFSTGHFSTQLPHTEFADNGRGSPDVAIFDFTNLYSAQNACRVKVRQGYQLLMAIVGDSLLEPFWPEGTGCARGFLGVLDAAWMLKQWASSKKNPLSILAERENTYHLLAQTTDGGTGPMKTGFKTFTIDPKTRYREIPQRTNVDKILSLYDTDSPEEFELLREPFANNQYFEGSEHLTLLQRIRKNVVSRRPKKPKISFRFVGNLARTIRRQRPAQTEAQVA